MKILGHFWHFETIFGVITDLSEVVICLVLPVASRLTIDYEWKRLTTLMISDWKIEFFRSFLALWDYFWSHNWLKWSCYLPCLAYGFSFDDRLWMKTTHNLYYFWIEKLNFLGHFWHSETIFGVITVLSEVFFCLVLTLASRLTIDYEWKRLTTFIIFEKEIEFFRSFLALRDYFWSHNCFMWSWFLPCLDSGFSFDDRFWMETTHNPYYFWLKKLNFSGHFWHSETIFGVITDLCEVDICLVLPMASRLTIDSEWKRLTTLIIFDWKIEFFRSFLALWDYFWSHNWLMWSCFLPCLAYGFSFDDRLWMETTHNPYDFW